MLPKGIRKAENQIDVRYTSKYDPVIRLWENLPTGQWLLLWNWKSKALAGEFRVSLRKKHADVKTSHNPKSDWSDFGVIQALGNNSSNDEINPLSFDQLEEISKPIMLSNSTKLYYTYYDGLPWRKYTYRRLEVPNSWRQLRRFNEMEIQPDIWYEVDLEFFLETMNGVFDEDEKWNKISARMRSYISAPFNSDPGTMVQTRFNRYGKILRYRLKSK